MIASLKRCEHASRERRRQQIINIFFRYRQTVHNMAQYYSRRAVLKFVQSVITQTRTYVYYNITTTFDYACSCSFITFIYIQLYIYIYIYIYCICDCGEVEQTMNHIVKTCPKGLFEQGTVGIHRVTKEAIEWLDELDLDL